MDISEPGTVIQQASDAHELLQSGLIDYRCHSRMFEKRLDLAAPGELSVNDRPVEVTQPVTIRDHPQTLSSRIEDDCGIKTVNLAQRCIRVVLGDEGEKQLSVRTHVEFLAPGKFIAIIELAVNPDGHPVFDAGLRLFLDDVTMDPRRRDPFRNDKFIENTLVSMHNRIAHPP